MEIIWTLDKYNYETATNKPCLSINDIKNISNWNNLVDGLKQIVKNKL
jgi:hypothetical protein